MDIEFVDELPPTRDGRSRRSEWEEAVEKLAANEGQWAKVKHYERAHSASIRASELKGSRAPKCFHPYRWETTVRSHDDGSGDLYMRCLGPVES